MPTDDITIDDLEVYQTKDGWSAFHKGGRELARSHSYDLLMDYLEDAVLAKPSRRKHGV